MAAAAAGEDSSAAVPPMLDFAWKTGKYGLPYRGGWMEQPLKLLNQMNAAEQVYRAVKMFNSPGVRWGDFPNQHPYQWGIVKTVMQLKKAHNGEE